MLYLMLCVSVESNKRYPVPFGRRLSAAAPPPPPRRNNSDDLAGYQAMGYRFECAVGGGESSQHSAAVQHQLPPRAVALRRGQIRRAAKRIARSEKQNF
ncbi:hypothetical protein EVAR_17402_1 [Eumeta japonica]|uniref:Uncharacterized protein n=1 Tax=Eumeta variegata TaxID=151549 RepID=A0A4C1V9R3_EUMVA|nr:hypothetical protein EVAR_17402_1 [Eumeta japonica]